MCNNLLIHHGGRRLTAAEKAWLVQLARHLAGAPRSLTFATSGDGLMVWDAAVHSALMDAGEDDCDGAVECAGGLNATIEHPAIHGVSG